MGTSAVTLPAAFLGHGSPMNAVERNRYTEAWRVFGQGVPRPKAILVVSAHWFINGTAVTAMQRPSEVRYDAPGMPELAGEVAEVVKPTWVGADVDSWGLDHGTWSLLVHAFPRADIPVVQLSINKLKPLEYHLELGAKLAPLRERGVLIVGSGNVVHNLRAIDWDEPDGAYDWTRRFDESARELMQRAPGEAPSLATHPDFRLASPTPDHFIPLLYLAGLAAAARKPAEVLVDGYSYGSISMTCFTLGLHCPEAAKAGKGGSAPVAQGVPADDSNL